MISRPPAALAPLSFWEPAQNCSRWICSWLPNGPCLSLLPLLLCLLIKHLSSLCQEPFLLQLSAIWNSYLINCSFFLLTHLKYFFFFFFACISACCLIEWAKHSHLFKPVSFIFDPTCISLLHYRMIKHSEVRLKWQMMGKPVK